MCPKTNPLTASGSSPEIYQEKEKKRGKKVKNDDKNYKIQGFVPSFQLYKFIWLINLHIFYISYLNSHGWGSASRQ